MQDVDIDVSDKFNPSQLFDQYTRASQIRRDQLVPHNVGYYFQGIPTDPWSTNVPISAIPYDIAEQTGFQKIDFLHLSFLDRFTNKQQLRELASREPRWELMDHSINVSKLFQLSNHFDIVSRVRPRSIDDVADIVALIRPGKRNLLERYMTNKQDVRSFLYLKTDQYYFKRSHAIGYAHVIAIQLHLIQAGQL
jgi:hypothetical protein